jgi:hypothetical protein
MRPFEAVFLLTQGNGGPEKRKSLRGKSKRLKRRKRQRLAREERAKALGRGVWSLALDYLDKVKVRL